MYVLEVEPRSSLYFHTTHYMEIHIFLTFINFVTVTREEMEVENVTRGTWMVRRILQ